VSRIALGKTAMRALKALDEHGPIPLSHGRRYASMSASGIYVMQSTNHLLRTSGMVEWAGGNYDRWSVRLTDYGRDCLKRGSRDADRRVSFTDSYGPRDGQ
jgi:hypothetical protein